MAYFSDLAILTDFTLNRQFLAYFEVRLKKLNRLDGAELQKSEEIPHFDHFPYPVEIHPYVVALRCFF